MLVEILSGEDRKAFMNFQFAQDDSSTIPASIPPSTPSSDDVIAKLKTGDMIPDSIFGWSSKTILAGLVIFLFIRR